MDATPREHIEVDPARCGGKPCIKGTRVRVWDIYLASEVAGKCPEELLLDYPHLTLADVHAALAYYWDHQVEITAQMKAADEYVEGLRKRAKTSLLADRLGQANSTGLGSASDAVSS